jgi:hypothetical protein
VAVTSEFLEQLREVLQRRQTADMQEQLSQPSEIPAPPMAPPMPSPQFQQPRYDVPADPREGQLQQQIAQMDRPRKIGGLETLAKIGMGIGGVNPMQLQQQEDAQRQQKRQNLAQQLQSIMAQRQQGQQTQERGWEREDAQNYRQQQMGMEQDRFGLERERLNLAQQAEQRQSELASRPMEVTGGASLMNPQGQVLGTAPMAERPTAPEELVDIPAIPQLGFAGMKSVPKSIAASLVSQLGQTSRQGTDAPSRIDPLSAEGQAAQIAIDKAKEANKTAGAGGQQSPYSKERATRALADIEDVRSMVSGWTTGFGADALAAVGGTDARTLQGKLNTLKANIAFNELAQMREASKTGGALGSVSDKEAKLLESSLGALDQGLKGAALIGELDKIKGSIDRWQREMDKKPVNPAAPASQPALKPGTVQDGYTYLGGDPSKPTSWRKAQPQGQRGR